MAPHSWVEDTQFMEWVSELVGVRVGVVASDRKLREVVKLSLHRLPESDVSQKIAREVLGRSALEAFGLSGAIHALYTPFMIDVERRVGGGQLAMDALAFVADRVIRPGAGDSFRALSWEKIKFGNLPYALIRLDRSRAEEVRDEAERVLGKSTADVVAAILEEIHFRIRRDVILMGSESAWRDALALSELFDSSSVTTAYGRFFDQRFVDYLAINFEEIGAMHWRKFEALVAERFHREGFEVELGPGSNDNGVDIRLWESGSDSMTVSPAVIVQCKRQKDKVEKVVVKALAADVQWEGARQGMLVATAEWSPGSREVVKTRKYPIEEVNLSTLRTWIIGMRTTGSGLWLAT